MSSTSPSLPLQPKTAPGPQGKIPCPGPPSHPGPPCPAGAPPSCSAELSQTWGPRGSVPSRAVAQAWTGTDTQLPPLPWPQGWPCPGLVPALSLSRGHLLTQGSHAPVPAQHCQCDPQGHRSGTVPGRASWELPLPPFTTDTPCHFQEMFPPYGTLTTQKGPVVGQAGKPFRHLICLFVLDFSEEAAVTWKIFHFPVGALCLFCWRIEER